MPAIVTADGTDLPAASRIWVYTATIGTNWAGFPVRQYQNFRVPGTTGALPLDVTGHLYLTGRRELDVNGVLQPWQSFNPPIAIEQLYWMHTPNTNRLVGLQADTMLGGACCFYSGCPFDNPTLPSFDGAGYQGCVGYLCPWQSRRLLDSTNGFPVTASGDIHLVDAHGGAISDTWVRLSGTGSIQENSPIDPSINTTYVIYLNVARPGVYSNGAQVFDVHVGDTVQRQINHSYGPSPSSVIAAFPIAIAVHMTAADVPYASRGFVDMADLGSIAGAIGKHPLYGLFDEDTSCSGSNTCTWWWNDLDGDGSVDSGDVARLAMELGTGCQIQKTSPDDSPANILAWFGFAYTGGMIQERNGVQIPAVRLVDEAQLARALVDPMGYRGRATASATNSGWGQVKGLYR